MAKFQFLKLRVKPSPSRASREPGQHVLVFSLLNYRRGEILKSTKFSKTQSVFRSPEPGARAYGTEPENWSLSAPSGPRPEARINLAFGRAVSAAGTVTGPPARRCPVTSDSDSDSWPGSGNSGEARPTLGRVRLCDSQLMQFQHRADQKKASGSKNDAGLSVRLPA